MASFGVNIFFCFLNLLLSFLQFPGLILADACYNLLIRHCIPTSNAHFKQRCCSIVAIHPTAVQSWGRLVDVLALPGRVCTGSDFCLFVLFFLKKTTAVVFTVPYLCCFFNYLWFHSSTKRSKGLLSKLTSTLLKYGQRSIVTHLHAKISGKKWNP